MSPALTAIMVLQAGADEADIPVICALRAKEQQKDQTETSVSSAACWLPIDVLER